MHIKPIPSPNKFKMTKTQHFPLSNNTYAFSNVGFYPFNFDKDMLLKILFIHNIRMFYQASRRIFFIASKIKCCMDLVIKTANISIHLPNMKKRGRANIYWLF